MAGGTDALDRSAGASSTEQDPAGQGSRAGPSAAPSEGPVPERKAAELRNDAAEEERRKKLRQVGIVAVNNVSSVQPACVTSTLAHTETILCSNELSCKSRTM